MLNRARLLLLLVLPFVVVRPPIPVRPAVASSFQVRFQPCCINSLGGRRLPSGVSWFIVKMLLFDHDRKQSTTVQVWKGQRGLRFVSLFKIQKSKTKSTAPKIPATMALPPSATMTDTRPWVERYRPVNLDQVSHQTEIVATLKDAVATGRLPHLLLYGPPGSGKVRFV
jgi:hypothetical protein